MVIAVVCNIAGDRASSGTVGPVLRLTALFLVVAVTTAGASPAAEKLFQDGRALLNEGKLAEACEAFRRSNDLEQKVGTLLNLANCEERRGRVASAWATFIEARALAKRISPDDPRIAVADKYAAALAPRLPYLTIRVRADQRPEGLVVRRNNIEVPVAEQGLELPLDPGSYTLEAAAPGHRPWSKTIELRERARVAVDIPALEADPSAAAAPATSAAIAPATSATTAGVTAGVAPVAPVRARRYAAGVALGASTDGDIIGGLRGVLTLADAGPGSIRLVPSALYTRMGDPDDVYQHFDLFAFGLAGEYVAPLSRQFFIAGGFGLGVDIIKDAYRNPLQTHAWVAARLSPTYRAGPVDIGLHLQFVVATKVVGLGELGIDYFF